MGTPLGTGHTPAAPATRVPGQFARHPKTGAPWVAHPTETTKNGWPGTKADLIALCAARGISWQSDLDIDPRKMPTVAQLQGLLGPCPKKVQYGRPSGLGKQIEDATNLQKWSERMVSLGIARDSDLARDAAELVHLDPDSAEFKEAADAVARRAKTVAQAHLAAERGTHHHELTEDNDLDRDPTVRMAAGEDLGVPAAVQAALLAAWARTLDTFDIEILATEATCVDDVWRQAGTLDRICRLRQAVKFTMPTGEIVELPAGWVGILDIKGLALDTPIPTPTGWTTIGAIDVGDRVIDRHGNPCTVLAKSAIRNRRCYRITFADTSQVVADDEHRWVVESSRTGREIEMTTAELAAAIAGRGGQRDLRIVNTKPLDLPPADLPIDPYLLGVWLGDGHNKRNVITKTADSGIWAEIARRGYQLGIEQPDRRGGLAVTRSVLGLTAALRAANLIGHKHVPPAYLRGSEQQRRDLLAGLMDSDGTWNKARHSAMFCSTNKHLAHQVYELLVSLGERALVSTVRARGFGVETDAHQVTFTPATGNPFLAPEKARRAVVRDTRQNTRRIIVAVDEIPSVPTQCIAVDSPDHTYLCGESMIPTHNTGRLRLGHDGFVAYWHAYSVQLASYSQAVPYDCDSDTRGVWPWTIDQRWAVIAHLDILGALTRGEATCLLVLVDLEAGRHAGALAVAAKTWENRRDVFSIPTAGLSVSVPVTDEMSPAPRPPAAGIVDDFDTAFDTTVATDPPPADATTVEAVVDDFDTAIDATPAAGATSPAPRRGGWLRQAQTARADTFREADARRNAPATIDEGTTVKLDDAFAALQAEYARIPKPARSWIKDRLDESITAGCSWQFNAGSGQRSGRRWWIARALITLAAGDQLDDDIVRALLSPLVGGVAFDLPVGHAIGLLDATDAERFAAATREQISTGPTRSVA